MTRAVVREIDGKLVLDDPDALGVIRAVEKHNCRLLFDANRERIDHFIERARVLGQADVVIVILNVDDVHGGPIAELLMPGHDWQAYRDRGEIPIARGLAGRGGIEDAIRFFDEEAADKLRDMDALSVVVVDRGVAEVLPVGREETRS